MVLPRKIYYHRLKGVVCPALLGTFQFGPAAKDALLPHLPSVLHTRAGEGPAAVWMGATLRIEGDCDA